VDSTQEISRTVGELRARGLSPTDCRSVCSLATAGSGLPTVASCSFLEAPPLDTAMPDAFLIDAWEPPDVPIGPDANDDAAVDDAGSIDADPVSSDDAGFDRFTDAGTDDAGMASTSDAGTDAGFDPLSAQLVRASCVIQECRPAGRRPAQARLATTRSSGVTAWLSEVAMLEAASVPAFAELRRELRAHGAPRSLVHATVSAERDEVRHAQLVGRLARRSGGAPLRAAVRRSETRTLAELAVHNASEGCVRESYGALSAYVQSQRAADPETRRVFAEIARDEARHALLSLALDEWARPRLRAIDRRRANEAKELASEELRSSLLRDTEAVRSVLGVPDEESGRALVALCQA